MNKTFRDTKPAEACPEIGADDDMPAPFRLLARLMWGAAACVAMLVLLALSPFLPTRG